MTAKVKELGESIARNNGGAYSLTLGRAAIVAGEGPNRFAGRFANAGFLVRPVGRRKMVDVFDLAEYMLANRISPVDNLRWRSA